MIQPSATAQKSELRAGAVLIEFATALPIVVIFFSGMIEIGRVMMLQHTADTAAYEGARDAMVPGATADEAMKEAAQLLANAGLLSSVIKISPDVITEETSFLTVEVEISALADSLKQLSCRPQDYAPTDCRG